MNQIDKAISNLSSPNKNKRYEACEELRVADSLPEPTITALEAATQDPDPLVAEAARQALASHEPSPPPIEPASSSQDLLIPPTLARNLAGSLSLAAGVLSVIASLCYLLIPVPMELGNSDSMLLLLIALLLTGIVYFGYIFNIIFALTAITSGIVSLVKIKKSGDAGREIAIAGIVLGVVCITAAVIYYLLKSKAIY